ncbi:class III lanthionine synthetase LanKC [Streptomyces sp. HD]|uniref:class III lanthionine synthetase LanKC n=1 Tax=Streptomyces sp. HD TaxID=3020892 RepID=UPI002330C2E3|nr:class III lanthionine synthetase LanKC [Streptomyces sp. HD]MDC0768620.1 class III lanthionine synthetase LanKC [Streptomyces sp. HD]
MHVSAGRDQADGTLTPDLRRPVFTVPDWAPVPPFIGELLERRRTGPECPYRIQRAMHFSNVGGVYPAERISDGKACVLKEARPGAGLEMKSDDAVNRLRREKWALQRLAGAEGAPELLDHFTMDSHEFLAMEYVDSSNLWVWMARIHPMIVSENSSPADYAAYTERVVAVLDRIERVLAGFHARGVGFGDLHYGNVLVRPDGSVALIDYEASFDAADTGHLPAVATMGFSAESGHRGLDLDRYCLASLKAALFLPYEKLRALDPSKVAQQLDFIAERFPLPDGWLDPVRELLLPAEGSPAAPLRPAPHTREAAVSMASAIAASADPARTDRLFPGDCEQFTTGGATFANGAAGVLWTLSACGFPVADAHQEWLLEAAGAPRPRQGFYNGTHGVANVLDHLGHTDAARKLIDQAMAPSREARGIGLYDGLAGIGLNYLHLADRWQTVAFDDDIRRIADLLGEALHANRPVTAAWHGGTARASQLPPVKAGLMRGWSGVALFFLRLYEVWGESAHLERSVAALHRDLDRCVTTPNGSLQVEEAGVRTLCYLDVDSAGIALVADEALTVHEDARLREQLPALLAACTPEFVVMPQLFMGRTGLVAALERAGRRDPSLAKDQVVARHLERLGWYALSYEGHLAFPGDLLMKLSMDASTGTAGVLLATQGVMGAQGRFLPFFTDRPSPAGGPTDPH